MESLEIFHLIRIHQYISIPPWHLVDLALFAKAAAAFRFPATSLAERAAVECLNEGQREAMGEAKGVVGWRDTP